MKDLIIIAIVLAISAAILAYLIRARRRGEVCIGCPYAKQCGAAATAPHPPAPCHGGCHVAEADGPETDVPPHPSIEAFASCCGHGGCHCCGGCEKSNPRP